MEVCFSKSIYFRSDLISFILMGFSAMCQENIVSNISLDVVFSEECNKITLKIDS